MVSCNTYSNRLFGCSHYKQENNYAKTFKLFIHQVIVQYKNCNDVGESNNFLNILINKFKKRSFSGSRLIFKEDKEVFENLCIKCAENLNYFFRTYKPTKLLKEYTYRSRVVGEIGCEVELEGVKYNVDFSPYDLKDTFYRLYYHRFNNYLYNEVNGCSHDMLVFMLSSGNYYSVKYQVEDYTIQYRGLLTQTIKRRTKRPGHQCLTCTVTGCKPRLISNLGVINGY